MRFNYYKSGYYDYLNYKENSIIAICDTGATYSIMDLYSWKILTGIDIEIALKEIENKITSGSIKVEVLQTASGNFDRVIPLVINNVVLAGKRFDTFYTYLNIDNNLWKNDGIIEINQTYQYIQPIILIGLNLIRCSEFIGTEKSITLVKFDYDKYERYSKSNIKNAFNAMYLENNTNINVNEIDIEANYINYLIKRKDIL